MDIPESTRYIDDYAFTNCSELEYVSMYMHTLVSKNNIFENCNKLKYIDLKVNVSKLSKVILSNL